MSRSYEDILVQSIGRFGWAQVWILLVTGLPKIPAAWIMILLGYAGAESKNWWLHTTKFNATSLVHEKILLFNECPSLANDTIVFDEQFKRNSIVSEWQLVCDRAWIVTAILTAQMVGVLIGAALGGSLGDYIGRRKTVLVMFTGELVFCLMEGFSVNWYMMCVAAFFVGVSSGGFLVLIYVCAMEFISTEYRTVTSVLPFWGLGVATFGLLFKYVPYWRHVCYVASSAGLLALIPMLFFLPESVRWLFTQKRYEEGKRVLCRLAKQNKMQEPETGELERIVELDSSQKKQKYTYLSLLRYRQTRWRAPVFAIFWLTCSFVYYGLTLGVSRLHGELYVNMLLMGIGDVTQYLLVWVLAKWFGRRNSTAILFLVTSLTSLGITVAFLAGAQNFKMIMNGLALTSRVLLAGTWSSVIMFTVESFPTVIRTTVYGFASVFGRVGGILAPQNKTLSQISVHLPFTVNGGLAMVCAGLCMLLADTYNRQLEDHLQEEVGVSPLHEHIPTKSTQEQKCSAENTKF